MSFALCLTHFLDNDLLGGLGGDASEIDWRQGINEKIAKLGVGKFFGESSLLDNAPRNAYVRARKAVLLYVLRKADLKAILRDTEAQVREATEKQRAEWEERNHAAETPLRAVDSESESDDSDDEP